MPGLATAGPRIDVPPVPPSAAARVHRAARATRLDGPTPVGTPTARLRAVIRRGTVGSVDPADQAAFEPWLRRELRHCRLARTTASHLVEHGQTVGLGVTIGRGLSTIHEELTRPWSGADLAMPSPVTGLGATVRSGTATAGAAVSAIEVRDGLLRVLDNPVTSAVADFQDDLRDAVLGAVGATVEGAGEAVGAVLEHLPGLGVLGAAMGVIKSSAALVMQAIRWPKIDAMLLSSISVIEREVLLAADLCEQRRQATASRQLGTSLAKLGAHALAFAAVPAAPVVNAVTTIIELTARVLRFLVDAVQVRGANALLARGAMTVEGLREVPALGLALPHLPGSSPLHVLGIVPPGWRPDTDAEQAGLLRAALRHPDNAPLLAALSRDVPAPMVGGAASAMAAGGVGNPWRHEVDRLASVLELTHRHGFDYRWKLTRAGRLVFAPQPVELMQKVGNLPVEAWRWLRGIPEAIERMPVETGEADDQVVPPTEAGEADGQRLRPASGTAVGPMVTVGTVTVETATRTEPRLPNTDHLTLEDV